MKKDDFVRYESLGNIITIGRIFDITNGWYKIRESKNKFFNVPINEAVILRSSEHIIDLIEIGDFVNGNKVLGKSVLNTFHKAKDDFYYTALELANYEFLYYTDIVTVLTKEEFENREFKV